jgi:hypothetical protein
MDEILADRSLPRRTKTMALTDTSEALQRFDHDTRCLTTVVLSVILVAAAVLAYEELAQSTFVGLETAPHPTESAASNPTPVRALSGPPKPADPKTIKSYSSSDSEQQFPLLPEQKTSFKGASHLPTQKRGY